MSKLIESFKTLLTKEFEGQSFELRSSKDDIEQRILDGIWKILDEIPAVVVKKVKVVEKPTMFKI